MILTDPEWQAVLLSLKVSSLAVLFSLPFGIFFAWLLVRCTFPGKALLDSVLHLPLVLPPVVVGYLLLVSMGRRGFIGERLYDWFGITFAFSWRGAVLAAAVMSFPLMVRAIRLALEGVDVKLEQAARTLGAGRWRVFFTITLPLTLPGIIVGTVLAFALCILLDYVIALLVLSVSLVQPSPLCRTFLVKREPFLLPCIP